VPPVFEAQRQILPPPIQCKIECDAPCQPPYGVESLPLEEQAPALLVCREKDTAALRLCELSRRSCIDGWPSP
jgi:hypothetical protein